MDNLLENACVIKDFFLSIPPRQLALWSSGGLAVSVLVYIYLVYACYYLSLAAVYCMLVLSFYSTLDHFLSVFLLLLPQNIRRFLNLFASVVISAVITYCLSYILAILPAFWTFITFSTALGIILSSYWPEVLYYTTTGRWKPGAKSE